MPDSPLPTGPDVKHLLVPEELLKKLRDADNRLHIAREQLGEAHESTEYDHQHHVNERLDAVRQAEREVEELTAKIQEILTRPV